MDRSEAYVILIAEMQSISNKSVEALSELVGKAINTEASSKNGTHYSLSVKVNQNSENAYVLEGNIHDNSWRFRIISAIPRESGQLL